MIDIIIPVLNEEDILAEYQDYYEKLGSKARVLFVDGGSEDRTAHLASQFGKVIKAQMGRGLQKQQGLKLSESDIVLVLHVDTRIQLSTFDSIEEAVRNGCQAGCLTLKIDDANPMFRFYEKIINTRAGRCGILDGDCGLFARRAIIEKAGGFDPVFYMEDLLIGQKLRKLTPIIQIPDTIIVSSRKWHERGFLRTFLDYSLAYLQLWLKSIPESQITHEKEVNNSPHRLCERT